MTFRDRQDPPRPDASGAEYRPDVSVGGVLHDAVDIHRLLVESISDYAIVVLDRTGHILTWNRGAQRCTRYEADEVIGRHFSIFYPDDVAKSGYPQQELAIAAAQGVFEDEGWRVRRDGSRFWANVVITALKNAAGEPIGYAKVTRDLTERREAELRAIEDAKRIAAAEMANRAKSEFLAAMSHELRTPLNAIGGHTDLLLLGIHGPLTEPQRDALERIRRSQQHLLGLITDLLNFSRIEAGRITYHLAPVRLGAVADAVRPMIEPRAIERRIAIEWQEPDDEVVAVADQPKVAQILLNLLTNAVKYTNPGGGAQVRHCVRGEWAVLEVSDNGIGIPPDMTEAIFEPFLQVGRSLTSPHEGVGLGLAISRELARAMGGDLTVQSTLNVGSTFTLTLPRAEVEPAGAG